MKKINTPLILVNFKTYSRATGTKALKLAEMAEKVSLETQVYIGIAPQFVDINPISLEVSIPIFAQHMDPIKPGSFTGHILPESILAAGAVGTLINHSERKLTLADIEMAVTRTRELNIFSVVCSNNPSVSTAAAVLMPNIIAVEPPELIGTGISVSKAKPEIVAETIRLVKRVNPNVIPLCGAGITTGEDVTAALKLGAEGVLVASGIVNAKDPHKTLLEFAEGITT